MKKLLLILSVFAVLLCSVLLLTGCGGAETNMTTKPSSSVSDAQTSDRASDSSAQSTSEKESTSMTGNAESRTDGEISNSSETKAK